MVATGTGSDRIKSSKAQNGAWVLCNYRSLPPWMQDNEYLLAGHRPPLPSYFACFRSIFCLHSETVNIWTHLFGSLLFVVLAILFLKKPATFQETLVFLPFFLGAILCMGFSCAFHTVHCHSAPVVKLFGRLDYCGIALLISGSFVPWLYYGFYCHFWLKVIYMSIVSTLGICAVIVSLSEKFGEPAYRTFRATVFTVFGLSGVVPALHCIFLEGWGMIIAHVIPLVVTAFLYILGAALYALRVPEKIYPGKFDIWLQSHQIFHVLVVIATLVNYNGLMGIAAFRETRATDCF